MVFGDGVDFRQSAQLQDRVVDQWVECGTKVVHPAECFATAPWLLAASQLLCWLFESALVHALQLLFWLPRRLAPLPAYAA